MTNTPTLEQLIIEFEQLAETLGVLVRLAPAFDGDANLAKDLGTRMANMQDLLQELKAKGAH